MPTNIAFSGGVDAVPGFGSRNLLGFSGTWAAGDTWSFELVSPTLGNIMVGLGQLAGLPVTCILTFNSRIYLGQGSQFAFSDNDLPTRFEEQDPGAGFVAFLSQFGSQDGVGALSALQGRLAAFGRYSIQIWAVNGDPKQFNLVQALNNIGTNAPESVQQLGDYDCLFLDPSTGIRSLRAREVTLNAYVDDVGLPVDEILQAVLAGYDASGACGIVDPASKRYWLFLKDTIYVLSLFRSQKISAWTTFKPTYQSGNNQVAFTPEKFIVYGGQVYVRATSGEIFVYGGTDGVTYDNCVATCELPYLDNKNPVSNKTAKGIDAAFGGAWKVYAGMNPADGNTALELVLTDGDGTAPDEGNDSSFDKGNIPYEAQGTHFKIKFVSSSTSTKAAWVSQVVFKYKEGTQK